MKSVTWYVRADSMSFWETYNEVAEFLDGVRMNYDATQRAIREWQLSREMLKLSA